jgi:nitroreductase
MDTLEAIRTRRSIRAYTRQPVSPAAVESLLRAAMSAPSAMDQRPWQFVVVTDRAKLDGLTAILPGGQMLQQAPLAIVFCGDPTRETKLQGYWMQDCSAATENLLLAAHAQGLGAVWIGVYPAEGQVRGVRERLGIPAAVVPFSIVALGHPAEKLPPEDRYDRARVHANDW